MSAFYRILKNYTHTNHLVSLVRRYMWHHCVVPPLWAYLTIDTQIAIEFNLFIVSKTTSRHIHTQHTFWYIHECLIVEWIWIVLYYCSIDTPEPHLALFPIKCLDIRWIRKYQFLVLRWLLFIIFYRTKFSPAADLLGSANKLLFLTLSRYTYSFPSQHMYDSVINVWRMKLGELDQIQKHSLVVEAAKARELAFCKW